MKLALNVFIEDEYYDEIKMGVVEITPEIAQEYLSLMDSAQEVKEKTQSFFKLCIFNVDLTCIEDTDEIPEIENDYIKLDESINLDTLIDNHEIKTDGDVLNVSDNIIYWNTYIKHTTIRIYTSELTREFLQSIVEKG